MFEVSEADIEGLFKEVFANIRAEGEAASEDKTFVSVDDDDKHSEFDDIAGIWLKTYHLVRKFWGHPDLIEYAFEETIWNELVSLKNDFIAKKVDRVRLTLNNLNMVYNLLEIDYYDYVAKLEDSRMIKKEKHLELVNNIYLTFKSLAHVIIVILMILILCKVNRFRDV